MQEIDDPEAIAEVRRLLDLVKSEPEAMSLMFKTNPDLAQGFRPILSLLVRDFANSYSFLEDLYRQALGNIEPNSNALFLFSGNGQELLPARNVWTAGRLSAIDRGVSEATVMTTVATGTEFYQLDLAGKTPEEIISIIDCEPDFVISRHPNFVICPWAAKHLSSWINHIIPRGGKVMVTNYTKDEFWYLNSHTERETGINPDSFYYLEGVDEEIESSTGEIKGFFKSDRYVSVYS